MSDMRQFHVERGAKWAFVIAVVPPGVALFLTIVWPALVHWLRAS